MKKTNKYQLSQWEKTDRLMMEDFNGDNAKLEAALAGHDNALAKLTSGKADTATTNSLQTQINARATTAALNSLQTVVNGKVEIIVGKYAGDGKNSQSINLGFQPKALLVCRSDGWFSSASYSYGGIVAPGMDTTYNSRVSLTITSTGFNANNVSGGTGWGAYLNDNSQTYHYIAFK